MGIKQKIEGYVREWENRCYKKGIPDETPIEIEQNNLAPSYRKICLALLKNDHTLKSLGFSAPKSKVYNDLKYIELKERAIKNKTAIQLKLW